MHDTYNEGKDRYNLADTLIKLRRYDEARRELLRAIECKHLYGYTATIWNSWRLLHQLEQASGNSEAAAKARQKAIESYATYRRAGGENQNPGAQLCGLVFHAIQQGQLDQAAKNLAQYLEQVDEPWAKAMIPQLQAILRGDRDPALAADHALDYDDVVELQMLLEALENQAQE